MFPLFQLLFTDINMYTWACTQYLRLLLCDKNEAIVVNEITVNVLSEGEWKKIVNKTTEQPEEKKNQKPGLCNWSYLIITANAAFSIQSCTLNTKHIRSLASHPVRKLSFHKPHHSSCCLVTCLQAVQNFLWKNSSFIWIPTAEYKLVMIALFIKQFSNQSYCVLNSKQ